MCPVDTRPRFGGIISKAYDPVCLANAAPHMMPKFSGLLYVM